MIQPDDKTIRAFAHVAQNVPAVQEFIEDQYRTELERLPQSVNHMAVAQGRCQVWGEISKLLKDAPAHAAQSNG